VYGVSPNLFGTMIPQYWYPNDIPDFSPYSFTQQLYTTMGCVRPAGRGLLDGVWLTVGGGSSARMVMGSLYKTSLQLNLTSDLYLQQRAPTRPRPTYYWDRLRPLAFFDGGCVAGAVRWAEVLRGGGQAVLHAVGVPVRQPAGRAGVAVVVRAAVPRLVRVGARHPHAPVHAEGTGPPLRAARSAVLT
jgi:hypothetical protein